MAHLPTQLLAYLISPLIVVESDDFGQLIIFPSRACALNMDSSITKWPSWATATTWLWRACECSERNSALDATMLAAVPSASNCWGTTGVSTSHTSCSLLPTYHKQFTVRALCSLEFVYGNLTPCHISPVGAVKDRASCDSSSQHTALSRSAFSPAAVSWTTSGDKRLPECFGLQAIYTDMRVIHSSSAHTGLCVHFASAGLLNQQRGKRIHMGTVTYILLIHIQLGVCHTDTLRHPQTLTLRRTTTRQKF